MGHNRARVGVASARVIAVFRAKLRRHSETTRWVSSHSIEHPAAVLQPSHSRKLNAAFPLARGVLANIAWFVMVVGFGTSGCVDGELIARCCARCSSLSITCPKAGRN